jgi:hypothetical protein
VAAAIAQVAADRGFHADGFDPVQYLLVVASLRVATDEAFRDALGAAQKSGVSWNEIGSLVGTNAFEARAFYEQGQ